MAKRNFMHEEIFSPMKRTFRAYYVEDNYDDIVEAFAAVLKDYKFSDEIQITIEAPAKEPPKKQSTKVKKNKASGKAVPIGFQA